MSQTKASAMSPHGGRGAGEGRGSTDFITHITAREQTGAQEQRSLFIREINSPGRHISQKWLTGACMTRPLNGQQWGSLARKLTFDLVIYLSRDVSRTRDCLKGGSIVSRANILPSASL